MSEQGKRFSCWSAKHAAVLALAAAVVWPITAGAQEQAAATVSSAPITVQIAPPPVALYSAIMGGTSPVGAQSTPGKPIFAEYVIEHHQSFSDGNQIARTTTSTIYRDGQGRIRRESQLTVPGMPEGYGKTTFITIVDQQLGFGYVLNPQEMIANRYDLNAARPSYVARLSAQGSNNALLANTDSKAPAEANNSENSHWHLHSFFSHRSHNDSPSATAANGSTAQGSSSGQPGGQPGGQLSSGIPTADADGANAPANPPVMRIDQPFLAAPNPVRTENLGEQMMLGFRVRGTRVITTLPAGQIGNDRPIDIVSEQWFSPELELVMSSMHRDPWAGEITTVMTRLSRGEQPAALFAVPEHYKIIDTSNEAEHHVLEGQTQTPNW